MQLIAAIVKMSSTRLDGPIGNTYETAITAIDCVYNHGVDGNLTTHGESPGDGIHQKHNESRYFVIEKNGVV